jgi:hypothetical protein
MLGFLFPQDLLTCLAPPCMFPAASASGGAAHSFQVGGYTLDAGPSFHMGLADPPGTSRNPLAQVLELLDERVECKRYSQVGFRALACDNVPGV